MISELDRGFLLGDGVFETLLVLNRVAVWREEHLARMKKAARKLDLPFDVEQIETAVTDRLSLITSDLHALRITLTRGVTARGLAAEAETPTLIVTAAPFDPKLIGAPLRLAVSSVRRNPQSVSDRHKTLSYANNVFAAREAKSRGADDALMLSTDALVSCTSMANVFLVYGTVLVTPPEQDGVLPGIARRFLIEHASRFGFSVETRSIERDEIFDADGCFATNSLRLIQPVTSVDEADTSQLSAAMIDAIATQCGADLREKLA
jgi:branched-chain amino acid aminotransferase